MCGFEQQIPSVNQHHLDCQDTNNAKSNLAALAIKKWNIWREERKKMLVWHLLQPNTFNNDLKVQRCCNLSSLFHYKEHSQINHHLWVKRLKIKTNWFQCSEAHLSFDSTNHNFDRSCYKKFRGKAESTCAVMSNDTLGIGYEHVLLYWWGKKRGWCISEDEASDSSWRKISKQIQSERRSWSVSQCSCGWTELEETRLKHCRVLRVLAM